MPPDKLNNAVTILRFTEIPILLPKNTSSNSVTNPSDDEIARFLSVLPDLAERIMLINNAIPQITYRMISIIFTSIHFYANRYK